MSKFFISVGEPSGDLLGAELVAAMKLQLPEYQGFGITGPKLLEQGVESIADIKELSVMGFVEVIKHLTYIKRLEDRLLMEIDRQQPQFAILVDYPGFNMRLAEFLNVRNIPVIQFVAPQLWAWGEKRTGRLKEVTDLVMGIMPFEVDFFKQRGVNFKYVGTPQVDRAAQAQADFESFNLDPQNLTIGFFPGSRVGEISKMLPMAQGIRSVVRKIHPQIRFAVSIAPTLDHAPFCELIPEDKRHLIANLALGESVLIDDTSFVKGRSLDLMATVSSALVTSGTATLECGMSGCPLCVTYRMNPISFKIAKRLVKLPYVSLVNLVAGKEVIREFIQNFTYESVAEELVNLAKEGPYRDQVLGSLNSLKEVVLGDLSNRAAKTVKNFIDTKVQRA